MRESEDGVDEGAEEESEVGDEGRGGVLNVVSDVEDVPREEDVETDEGVAEQVLALLMQDLLERQFLSDYQEDDSSQADEGVDIEDLKWVIFPEEEDHGEDRLL